MSMRFCVFGNSHVASIKKAWDEINNQYPDYSLTFFAQRGRGLNALIPENGRLIPANMSLAMALEFTSNGKNEIVIDDYDVFIIYGLGLSAYVPRNNQYYSSAVLNACLKDMVSNTPSFNLLLKIKSLTNKPVYLGHVPLISEIGPTVTGEPKDYIYGHQLMDTAIFRPIQSVLVQQPLETIVNGNKTNPVYVTGSKRLSVGDDRDNELHPEDDLVHMNENFGKIWLHNFFAQCKNLK